MTVAIHYELKDFTRLREQLGGKVVEKALGMALQKVAAKARTQVSRKVREVYNIKASDIGRGVRPRRITSGTATVAWRIEYSGSALPLDKFGMRQIRVRTERGKRSGVSVLIKKAGGRKRVKSAFAANVNGQKVFQREGESRLPIKRLFSLSIPQMVATDKVMDEMLVKIRDECDVEFDRALRITLERAGKQ